MSRKWPALLAGESDSEETGGEGLAGRADGSWPKNTAAESGPDPSIGNGGY